MDVGILLKENEKDGVWCEFSDGVEFKINPLTQEDFNKFVTYSTSESMKKGSLQSKFDAEKYSLLCNKATVVAWKGINNGDKPWKCSPENITKLFSNSQEIKSFVEDQVDIIRKQRLQKALDATKN